MPAPVSSLIPLADALAGRDFHPGQDVPVQVWGVLSTIADHRCRRGRRHELATVLVVAVAGVLAGARSLASIAGWAADLPAWARPRLGIGGRAPSLSTIRRVLVGVDADVLDAVLHAWLAALTPPTTTDRVPASFRAPLRAVAVDGKTCRGARTGDGERVHLFSAVDHATGIPLGQVNAGSAGNDHGKVMGGGRDHEVAAFRAVLDRIDLDGVVVTADALHTQDAHAHYLHRHRGNYVFIVKRNRPKLHAQLASLPWKDVPAGDHTEEKGHGRRESRTLQVVQIAAGIGFPHAKLAARITRTRVRATTGAAGGTSRKTSTETVYAVTNLAWEEIRPAGLARIIRGHWTIENRVHHIRDTTWDEDRCQIRTGTAPRVMATLKNIAIGLIRTTEPGAGIAATTRTLGRKTDKVLALLDHRNVTPVTGVSTLN